MSRRTVKLIIAFDGTSYAGWQRQPDQATIQGVLEEKISLMCDESVLLHSAGRTDAGVHALAMPAHFQTISSIPCPGFRRGLNSLLPKDIRVLDAEDVASTFHARHNAIGKCYFYQMSLAKVMLPTSRLYSVLVQENLDIERMKQCLGKIEGRHDFSSFEASGSRDPLRPGKGAVRNIFSGRFHPVTDDGGLCLTICGDGFLRHMVRNIVGTLLEAGKGRLTVNDFEAILTARDRSTAGPTAPARGLFLREVFY